MTDADIQRQIRRARVSRVLFAVPAAILAYLFVVHVASGAVLLGVANALSAALFVASMVLATMRVRIMRRTLAGTGGKSTLSIPARERALRRLASRPRRIMTPDDYKRLREMETELGWEPSKVPESLAASGVVALEPRKPSAACDCCEDSLAVDVRAFGSAAPVARYCAECGRQRKRHEAAPSKALTARAKVSYGGTAALSGSGSLSAKATWDDVAYASEASEHFAQLARVGRESCISPCRMCEERWLETERWGGNEH